MNFVAPFTNSWFFNWIGLPLAIAGIPIALHFFFRSRYRTVPWAAMKFLLTSIEQTSRRLKFQELLLLMLRVLLLMAMAWAIQRPSTQVVRGAGRGDAVDAVFVFDTSFSMGARDGDKTRLERAQAEALRVLEHLPAQSTVQIIASADRSLDESKKKDAQEKDDGPEETGATLLGPREPANIDQARVIIQGLKLTSLATDLHPGVAQALSVLQRGQATNKELYVFSDMQKRGFEQQSAGLAQALQEAKEKAAIYLVRCGMNKVNNVAIVGITPQSGVPRPGERVGFAVLVRNTGAEAVKNLKVSLTADEDEKTTEAAEVPSIAPGETRSVTLTSKMDKAGLRLLTAKAGVDDLDGDNRFDQVILVRDQVNVLVVDGGANPRDPQKSSSFRLLHALLPVKEGDRGKYYLEPRVITPRLAAPGLLAKQDLVILVNVAVKANLKKPADVLPADFVAELSKFVKQGKGLLVFAGDNADPDAYNQVLGKADLLPLPVKGVIERPVATPLLFNRSSFQLPAYLKFKDDEYYRFFDETPVWKALELEMPKKPAPIQVKAKDEKEEEAKEAKQAKDPKEAAPKNDDPLTIALKYDSGQPAVVARKVGAGEVIFVTTAAEPGEKSDSPAPTWSLFPIMPLFVPFVDVTVNHLLHGQTRTYNLSAGENLVFFPSDPRLRSYTLLHPDGKQTRLGLPQRDEKSGKSYVVGRDLPTSGVYRMIAKEPTGGGADAPAVPEGAIPEATPKGGAPIAVTPDLRESEDLETLNKEQIDQRLGFTPIHITAGVEEATNQAADRLNREWTTWFLIAVLALTMCESLLAFWCGRAW